MFRTSKRVLSQTRAVIPIAIGLCVGITLSLLCSPLLDANCGFDSFVHVGSSRKTNAFYGMDENGNPLSDDDFEPVLMTANNPPIKQTLERNRLVRMRYVSSELGIREKLFVGVVVSRGDIDLESTTVGINKTISHYVSKLVFFTKSSDPESAPAGLNVVPIKAEQTVSRTFDIWANIYENYGNDYDWFLLIQDDTYLFGESMMDFVSTMSIGWDVYMGLPTHEADMEVTYCRRESGIKASPNRALSNAHSSLHCVGLVAVCGIWWQCFGSVVVGQQCVGFGGNVWNWWQCVGFNWWQCQCVDLVTVCVWDWWQHLGVCGTVWDCVAVCGSKWQCVRLGGTGSVGLVAVCGIVWQCVG